MIKIGRKSAPAHDSNRWRGKVGGVATVLDENGAYRDDRRVPSQFALTQLRMSRWKIGLESPRSASRTRKVIGQSH